MGLRYRKSIKIAPGVKLNIGKKSTGISIGGKYGGVSVNSKTGVQTRASIPGTGLSYTSSFGKKSHTGSSKTTIAKSSVPSKPPKELNPYVELVLCIFLGLLGVHRFYAGKIGTGILYLFTGGLFGIGWIVDIIIIVLRLTNAMSPSNVTAAQPITPAAQHTAADAVQTTPQPVKDTPNYDDSLTRKAIENVVATELAGKDSPELPNK